MKSTEHDNGQSKKIIKADVNRCIQLEALNRGTFIDREQNERHASDSDSSDIEGIRQARESQTGDPNGDRHRRRTSMSGTRKSPHLTVTLDGEMHRQVQLIADEVGGSASFIIRKAIKLYLKHRRDR